MENKTIPINPKNYAALVELMDHEKDYSSVLVGTNENGEDTITTIEKDYIEVETNQNNGWIRRNVYWRDGTTEELYNGHWK